MRATRTLSPALLTQGPIRRVVDVAAARGLKICAKTAIRWSTAGKRGIRLPSLRISEGRCTTAAAFDAWLQLLAELDAGEPASAPAPINDAEAERILEAHGLGRGAR